jgi:hypothetical protein
MRSEVETTTRRDDAKLLSVGRKAHGLGQRRRPSNVNLELRLLAQLAATANSQLRFNFEVGTVPYEQGALQLFGCHQVRGD